MAFLNEMNACFAYAYTKILGIPAITTLFAAVQIGLYIGFIPLASYKSYYFTNRILILQSSGSLERTHWCVHQRKLYILWKRLEKIIHKFIGTQWRLAFVFQYDVLYVERSYAWEKHGKHTVLCNAFIVDIPNKLLLLGIKFVSFRLDTWWLVRKIVFGWIFR